MQEYTIIKNTERYGDIGRELPNQFKIVGVSLKQAIEIAERLSNHEAGCDFAYYCKEDPEMTL